MSLPVVDATGVGTLLRNNPPRSAKKNVALVVTDLVHAALTARLAGLALVAASGEEHHHASHGGDENLTPGRDLSAD
jgi:hypothetical protein